MNCSPSPYDPEVYDSAYFLWPLGQHALGKALFGRRKRVATCEQGGSRDAVAHALR